MKELTERQCQALYNFHKEGISNKTLADHFGCSSVQVAEIILHRPWLQSRKPESEAVNLTWWQSDHSDPLELVKLYYPQYLPEGVTAETSAREKGTREYVLDLDKHFEKEGYEYGSLRYHMDTLFQEEIPA